MQTHDFDTAVQRVFHAAYADCHRVDWRRWLTINSPDAFEEAALKSSGLASCDCSLDGIVGHPAIDSRQIAVDPATLVPTTSSRPLVACHTSGTSRGPTAIKWFHMTEDLVQRLWAPGMQAIFESSGLTSTSSVAIFVPSRLQRDGLLTEDGRIRVRLYSAEFSQRLMLALLRPPRTSWTCTVPREASRRSRDCCPWSGSTWSLPPRPPSWAGPTVDDDSVEGCADRSTPYARGRGVDSGLR